jgi:hypothetical protein
MYPTQRNYPFRASHARGCVFAWGNAIQHAVFVRPVGYPVFEQRDDTIA